MQQTPGTAVPRKNRRVFSFAAIFLLLGAIVAVVIQKQCESAAAIAVAKAATRSDVTHHLQDAYFWGKVSLAIVALAILSWGIALWCREKHQWVLVPAIVLLFLYVMLKLIMV